MIAEEIQDEYENIMRAGWISQYFENDNIVAKMKKIVPEFKSMNSAF
jgi:hypothetical protein